MVEFFLDTAWLSLVSLRVSTGPQKRHVMTNVHQRSSSGSTEYADTHALNVLPDARGRRTRSIFLAAVPQNPVRVASGDGRAEQMLNGEPQALGQSSMSGEKSKPLFGKVCRKSTTYCCVFRALSAKAYGPMSRCEHAHLETHKSSAIAQGRT